MAMQQPGMPQMGMPQMNNLGNAPQLNDVISKYGEGYNGPIDLLGGGEKKKN